MENEEMEQFLNNLRKHAEERKKRFDEMKAALPELNKAAEGLKNLTIRKDKTIRDDVKLAHIKSAKERKPERTEVISQDEIIDLVIALELESDIVKIIENM